MFQDRLSGYILRQAADDDLEAACRIIMAARLRMKAAGRTQWQGSYPSREDIAADIDASHGFILADASAPDTPLAYCAVLVDGEPAYLELDGKWLSGGHYVVVHRMAVAENMLGNGLSRIFLEKIMEKASSDGIHSIKVDTNHDNVQMLHILRSMDFTFCGYIRYADGPRLAFEKLF